MGVKGASGPVPKRSDQRRRHTPAVKKPRKAAASASTKIPAADRKWHPVARRWYESLKRSGQQVFYEASDWATAYVIAESISRELQPQPLVIGDGVEMVSLPPKAAALAAWLKGMTALLVTEGDRRRAALELQRPEPVKEAGADVSELAAYRRRLKSG